ncbi:hypothetical protein F2Q70_00041680 [Brassica cretica]|uniref:Uncharacterized protein n=2 Tax=Brassica TaxID=3705 RepID=A0A8S9KBF0_BRACR|nr:hypothetical protein F2Q70_00041680 [Brassica cretica]
MSHSAIGLGSLANTRRLRSSGCDASELSTPTTACVTLQFSDYISFNPSIYVSSIWFSFFNSPSRFQLPKHHSRDDASSDPRDIESVKKKLYLAWKPSSGVDFALEEWMVDQMHIVRPAVETVFENLLLQLLLAKKIPSIRKFHLAEGLNVDGVLESWGKIKPVSWKLGMKKLEMIGLKRT